MSRLDLAGKVALVTGGGAGIGQATAQLLHARGSAVAVLDREETAARTTANQLGTGAMSICADVTDAWAMTNAVGQVVEELGGVDIVVANAGITPAPATLRHTDSADFARVQSVNVLGVLHTVQPALEQLIARRGQVAVVASAAAYSPPLGGSAYMVSKAAVEVLARALRLELAPHGVGVTTVAFGFVDTQLARTTLDEHEVGRALDSMLPRPLRHRLSAEEAATAVVDAVEQRAVRVTRPRAWAPLGVFRGIVTPAMDAALVRSRRTRQIVKLLEGDPA